MIQAEEQSFGKYIKMILKRHSIMKLAVWVEQMVLSTKRRKTKHGGSLSESSGYQHLVFPFIGFVGCETPGIPTERSRLRETAPRSSLLSAKGLLVFSILAKVLDLREPRDPPLARCPDISNWDHMHHNLVSSMASYFCAIWYAGFLLLLLLLLSFFNALVLSREC